MKRQTKDELGGLVLGLGVATLLWLLLAVGGCGLPNAPNARPTPKRVAEPLSHDGVRTFQPGVMPSITVLPPCGQQFDTTAAVYMQLTWQEVGDVQYRWDGRTCAQLGGVKLGEAGECCPEGDGGIIAAVVTPDSVTIWGSMSTHYPAPPAEPTDPWFYEIETQVGALRVITATPPTYRLSPLTCSGAVIGCRITGGCASDKGGAADAGLLVRDVP